MIGDDFENSLRMIAPFHAVCSLELVQINGSYGIKIVNSWADQSGLMPESQKSNNGHAGDHVTGGG